MANSWIHRTVLRLVAATAVLAAAVAVQAAEPLPFKADTDPTAFCEAVQSVVEREDFDTLDATLRAARTLQARFAGGKTELEALYHTLFYDACPGYQMSRNEAVAMKRAKTFEKWLARKSDPAAPAIALAGLWSGYAWIARGGGYAREVRSDAWPKFHDRLKVAADYMRDVDPAQDPEAYSVLLNLARDLNRPRPEIDALFNEARRRFPTYFSYYKDYVEILEPQWFGAPGDVARFLDSLRNDPGGDLGAAALSQATEAVAYQMAGPGVFRDTGLAWPEVRRAFALRQKTYGLSPESWNVLTYLAVMAGDRAAAREYYRHAAPHLTEWPRWPGGTTSDFYLHVLPWIMARDADSRSSIDGPLTR